MCTNESLNNKHDIRIKWVRKFGVGYTSYTSFLGNLVLPRLTGGLQKLDFSPFPVFLKLSHKPELSCQWPSKPMAKQARQIWTEKLGLVYPLSFSGVIFREIGHVATIPIFWSNQCKKSTNYKTRMDPRDLQN